MGRGRVHRLRRDVSEALKREEEYEDDFEQDEECSDGDEWAICSPACLKREASQTYEDDFEDPSSGEDDKNYETAAYDDDFEDPTDDESGLSGVPVTGGDTRR